MENNEAMKGVKRFRLMAYKVMDYPNTPASDRVGAVYTMDTRILLR